jgi:hypothetical protein
MKYETIVLDLEGTLITSAVSQIPRPGISRFLNFCDIMFENVVIFSDISSRKACEIVKNLVDDYYAPKWFMTIPILDRGFVSDNKKDLSYLSYFKIDPSKALIVDDNESYIVDDQLSQYVKIKCFDGNEDSSEELVRIMDELSSRNGKI